MDIKTSENPEVVFRFCPRCGSNSVKVNGHSIECPECGLHLFFNAAASVIALIEDKEGRILLTQRAREPYKGYLDLPGGFADPGEGIETTLHREIQEELNLEVDSLSYFGSSSNIYPFSGVNIFTTDIVFKCRVCNWEGMEAADDVEEILFFHKGEIPFEKVFPGSIQEVLKRYCEEED